MLRPTLLVLLLLGIGGISAAWAMSARHRAEARREAAAHPAIAWQHLLQARKTWYLGTEDHLLAAQLARRLGDPAQARVHLAAHAKRGGDARAREFEQRLLLVQEGNLAGLDNDLLELVESGHPASADILESLARGALKTNPQAGLNLKRLAELWPDRLVRSGWRGMVHFHLGNLPEAIAGLTPFVDGAPEENEMRLVLAQACFRAGRSAEGLSHCRRLQSIGPVSPPVLLGLAMCLQDEGRLDEAAAALDRLLELDPDHHDGLVERGRVAFRQGRPRDGENWARRAVEKYPNSAQPHLILAFCLEAQGRQTEAKQHQQLWQSYDAAQYHLSQVLPQLGRSPDDIDLRFQAGSSLLKLGDQEGGLAALGDVLRREPNHRPTHRLLAEYYAGRGQTDLAAKHRRAAAP